MKIRCSQKSAAASGNNQEFKTRRRRLVAGDAMHVETDLSYNQRKLGDAEAARRSLGADGTHGTQGD